MASPPEPRPAAPPFPAWRTALGTLTLALVVVTGLLLCGLWNSGWFVQVPRAFEPAGLACRVEMPGAVHASALLAGAPGADWDGPQFAVRRRFPWESFGLAARDLPGDFDESAGDPLAPMDDYLREFLATLPGAPVPAFETVPHPAYPVRQAAVASPVYGNVLARVVLGGPRLYLLVAAGKTVTPERPDVRRFFDSFEGTDDDDRRAALAALPRLAAAERHRAAHAAFDLRAYGGPPPADPATLPGLSQSWPCDEAAPGWRWRGTPAASAAGVRGRAVAFGHGAVHTATLTRPAELFPPRPWALAFWYRATPGDGPLIDFTPDEEADAAVELVGNELRFEVPGGRDVRVPRPPDGDWHHVALVQRGPRSPTELWVDGEAAGAVDPAPDSPAVESRAFAFGGRTGGRPADGAFRAAVDDLCLFDGALSDDDLRRLAAAPALPAETPLWMRPDGGLPRPLLYLAWDPAAARTRQLADAVGRRGYAVDGALEEVPAPAGRGYAVTPDSPKPAVNLAAWRFPPGSWPAAKAGQHEVAPFTAVAWASYDAATPLELLRAGDLRLLVTGGEARAEARQARKPAFVRRGLAEGWHHYGVTRSRTGVVKFYVDGVAVPGEAEVFGTDDRAPHPLTLGSGAAGETFRLADFAVFAGELTPTQVRRIASTRLAE